MLTINETDSLALSVDTWLRPRHP